MLRALFVLAAATLPAAAQSPLRFAWKAGDSHAYGLQHTTTVTETLPDEKTRKPVATTATTKVTLARTWAVKSVDAAGVATLELTITSMKQEHTQPDGTVVVLDSASAEGAKAMSAFLNKPAVTARVDARGQLVDAQSAVGDTSRLRTELPFRAVLPEAVVSVNATWERNFAIKLDPPLGTGESYDAVQNYTFKGQNGDFAVIGLSTVLRKPPTAAADLQPLVSWLWEGDVFFDAKAGRYHAAKLKATKEIANHQGEGSKFAYVSEYAEALAK